MRAAAGESHYHKTGEFWVRWTVSILLDVTAWSWPTEQNSLNNSKTTRKRLLNVLLLQTTDLKTKTNQSFRHLPLNNSIQSFFIYCCIFCLVFDYSVLLWLFFYLNSFYSLSLSFFCAISWHISAVRLIAHTGIKTQRHLQSGRCCLPTRKTLKNTR